MDTLKFKILSYIHHSNSYFARKIRDYLPTSWKDILCDYEFNDLKIELLATTKKYEAEYESDEGAGIGSGAGAEAEAEAGAEAGAEAEVVEEETSFFSLKYLWEKGCPDKI